MLVAESSRAGPTARGIRVGDPATTLRADADELSFDEHRGLWSDPHRPGIWYELARPHHPWEEVSANGWVSELYEISNWDEAFVARIYVMEVME